MELDKYFIMKFGSGASKDELQAKINELQGTIDAAIEEATKEHQEHESTVNELRRELSSAKEGEKAEKNLRMKFVSSEKELKKSLAELGDEVARLLSVVEKTEGSRDEALSNVTTISEELAKVKADAAAAQSLKDASNKKLKGTVDKMSSEFASLIASSQGESSRIDRE